MRTSSTCVYVTFIAVFDLITLVSGMTNEWLKVSVTSSILDIFTQSQEKSVLNSGV